MSVSNPSSDLGDTPSLGGLGEGGQELLREECEKRGLPVSLRALLRHIENNHAAAMGFKDLTIETLTRQRDEARALLKDGER